jgi:hypothetical protein
MVPPDDRCRRLDSFDEEYLCSLRLKHINVRRVATAPQIIPGKNPAATALPGKAGHCWVNMVALGPRPGKGLVVGSEAGIEEVGFDAGVTAIEAGDTEVEDGEPDDAPVEDVSLSITHILPAWHVYPKGQQEPPHFGRLSVSRVVFKVD